MKTQKNITPKNQSEFAVLCPWCRKGETLADASADIRVSCSCRICGKFYRIDFNTMCAVKIRAKSRENYQIIK